ncbi:hypothetical protein HY988_04230 [Candidatus Micrarchaeota archaeon]|nr:hypothetical protein [Candidatus Micrarchaeota archaeon]
MVLRDQQQLRARQLRASRELRAEDRYLRGTFRFPIHLTEVLYDPHARSEPDRQELLRDAPSLQRIRIEFEGGGMDLWTTQEKPPMIDVYTTHMTTDGLPYATSPLAGSSVVEVRLSAFTHQRRVGEATFRLIFSDRSDPLNDEGLVRHYDTTPLIINLQPAQIVLSIKYDGSTGQPENRVIDLARIYADLNCIPRTD